MDINEPTQDSIDALIPELREWNGGKGGVTPEDWVGMVGTYDLALGYSFLFWPRFVQFEGYVLRQGFLEASLRGFEKATEGDRQAVEAVMNHVHIVDIHMNAPAPNEPQMRHLGRVLKAIYESKLKSDFPDLTFVVDFRDEPRLDPLDYDFTFWQKVG